jgi:hypothetical protein
MIYDDECGAVGGMRIGRGNRNTRRKPYPVPLFPETCGYCYSEIIPCEIEINNKQ